MDSGEAGLRVAAGAQEVGEPLAVDDGVQIAGTLLGAVAAVQVAADGGVAGVAGDLVNGSIWSATAARATDLSVVTSRIHPRYVPKLLAERLRFRRGQGIQLPV